MNRPNTLTTFIQEKMTDHRIPGVSIGILLGNETHKLAGRYSRPMVDLELTVTEGKLIGQVTPKQGFPTKETPPRPPSPLHEYGLLANGDLMALDGPLKGAQLQILRQEDGSIGWIRGAMRLHHKG